MRLSRWVDGHPGFDSAMGDGKPIDALRSLLKGWLTTAPGTLRNWRPPPRYDPVGFPQQHNGRVLDLQGRRRTLGALRRCQAVMVEGTVTATVIDLAAAGVPLVSAQPPESELADADSGIVEQLASVDVEALGDVRLRELHSVRIRRRALELSMSAEPTPEVSVILATRRPEMVAHALEMIADQTLASVEVVVGLHGEGFTPSVAAAPGVKVHNYPDGRLLGEVLQDLTERSRGEFISKWDDDDWYGPHHLQDLVTALRYSGAELVGKAAEFVFLEELGVTIRRMSLGAETWSSMIAGGALLSSREAIDRAGGWPPAARNVDLGLIERIRGTGGRIYRTHGFEYVLRRTGSGHTWAAPPSYFIGHAVDQRPGLDLEFAGFDGH